MRGKKNVQTGLKDFDPALLEELFPSDDSRVLHDFDESSLASVGRIIAYSSAMGGLVTFYYSAHYECLCCSVRFGERKRTLYLNGEDFNATECEQFANGIARAYLATLNDAGHTQKPGEKSKKRKAQG